LERPEFNDPEQLQELFRAGVEEFKEVGAMERWSDRAMAWHGMT